MGRNQADWNRPLSWNFRPSEFDQYQIRQPRLLQEQDPDVVVSLQRVLAETHGKSLSPFLPRSVEGKSQSRIFSSHSFSKNKGGKPSSEFRKKSASVSQKMKEHPRLIGLTGTNGAGKGEAAAYLEKKRYEYFSLSDLIREELTKRDEEVTRDNLIRMGNQLREKFGADILARQVMEKIKGKAVIDSIRNPKEVEYLRKQKDFILLSIDAPVELRYERVRQRGRIESALNLREFIRKEEEEMTSRKNGQQLRNCMSLADITLTNDGTLEDLYQKLEALL